MENLEPKDITPEQRKDIEKILSKTKWRLSWVIVKFTAGLFLTNFISIGIAIAFFKDSDLDVIKAFQFVSMTINFIFMARYLHGQLQKNSDIVNEEIKKVLKK